MKLIGKYIAFALLLITSACDLKEKPLDFVNPEEYYRTNEELIYGLNGAYSTLRNTSYYGANFPLASEAFIDVLYSSNTNFTPYSNVNSTLGLANNATLMGMWAALYSTINHANVVISRAQGATGSTITESVRERVIAEAKFLRALTYFNLVRAWDEVPLRTQRATDFANPNIPLSPITDIYNLIIEDLKYGEEKLWNKGETRDNFTNDIGRADVLAAKTLLAKVYLTIASSARSSDGVRNKLYKDNYDPTTYYTLCKQKLDEVIALPDFGLETNWKEIWNASNKNGKEIIFDVQYSAKPNQGSNYFALFTPKSATSNLLSAYGPYGVLGFFTNYYSKQANYQFSPESTDKRIIDGMMNSYIDKFELDANKNPRKVIFKKATTGTNAYRYEYENYTAKAPSDAGAWRVAKWLDPSTATANMSPLNWPVLRSAEVYLMRAEAEVELSGVATDGFEDYNKVRGRCTTALLSETELSSYEGANDLEKFREAIIRERIFEFIMEGYRYFDSKRLGKIKEAADHIISGGGNASTRSRDLPQYYYWPISQDELDANNAILSQKSGY
ncbi:MAG: RagB/SusD family nutrient uptake outer membrane protein [Bacteroidales bacterium]|nr:RagB/SusD family nutrient uptake outer membrane protein [Bacteroidales bacterium]